MWYSELVFTCKKKKKEEEGKRRRRKDEEEKDNREGGGRRRRRVGGGEENAEDKSMGSTVLSAFQDLPGTAHSTHFRLVLLQV